MKPLALFLAICTMIAGGCTSHIQTGVISGHVSFSKQTELPQGSIMTVTLSNNTVHSLNNKALAKSSLNVKGTPPYSYNLAYDPEQMVLGRSYTLNARINNPDGQLLYTGAREKNNFIEEDNDIPLKLNEANKAKNLPLHNTQWILSHLKGKPAPLGMQDQAVNLVVDQDAVAAGFSGCNRYHGRYLDNSGQIASGPMATTMMACPKGMELEAEYLSHLSHTTSYEINGSTLSLKDQSDTELLRFVSP